MQLPFLLMDWRMFSPASRSRHHRCRYCQPMSECGIGSASSGSFSSSMASRRRCWAMSGCRLTSQATISLDPISYTGAGYALPSATLNSVTSVPSFTHGRSAVKSRFSRFSALAPVSPRYELYFRYGFGLRIRHSRPMRLMTFSTLLWLTRTPNSCTRHMRICRWPHPLGVRANISATIGSMSGRVTAAGCDRRW